MSDREFRMLLDLLMSADPWPLEAADRDVLEAMLDAEAVRRGFKHWQAAYHQFQGNPELKVASAG